MANNDTHMGDKAIRKEHLGRGILVEKCGGVNDRRHQRDTEKICRALREIGNKNLGTIEIEFFSPEQFREHFSKVSRERFEGEQWQ